uniref:Ig-like domain-containing protein n=1 Tax=Amphimedon queenslandica TaxID=400682 RepID=A0A1X7SU41_AMPQE
MAICASRCCQNAHPAFAVLFFMTGANLKLFCSYNRGYVRTPPGYGPETAAISPSNDSVPLCDGFTRNFTCETSGITLVWLLGTQSATFGSTSTISRSLGPYIDTHFVSAGGGMVIAIATVTASSGLNGTTLECRNTSGIISTTARAFFTFNVEGKLAINIIVHICCTHKQVSTF